ncbi:Alpha/Beta hydrolase protein [Leptodontidium sp. MPI-SDFR-AT-0119]|nr:Alpha/Beta hydrolase protein [Leptodontidium sp. MPI-SDFR-AT-0119]
MSTHQTAVTKYVTVKDIKFAYRLFGAESGIPLVCLQHYRGTMDHWDPLPLNTLALTRPIFLIDYAGTGLSTGSTPTTFSGWASDIASVLEALNIPAVDLLGFSVGSFAAQMVALNYPELVKHLILCGSGPSATEGLQPTGEGIFEGFTSAVTFEENKAIYLSAFYTSSAESQKAGLEAWERITTSRQDRSDWTDEKSTQNQVAAVMEWLKGEGDVSFPRLGELKMPVLVAAGAKDDVVATANSLVLWKEIEKGFLCVYPQASHGFMSQYGVLFANNVELFLGSEMGG